MGGEVRLDSTSAPTVFTLDLSGEPVPPGAQRGVPLFSRENAAAEPEQVSRSS
jgi:hypothetical protein